MTVKKYLKESIRVGDRDLTVEVGRVAKQADGSCVIRYGDTMLLCAAVGALTPREGMDFFPLTVEYREAFFAAGRIPGNYFRREGRPNEKEVLTCRMIDRPCRPLFTEGYRNETQVVASVISADPDNNPDVIAITGASCALYLSDIPFPNPIAGVRVGLIDGQYIVNPTYDESSRVEAQSDRGRNRRSHRHGRSGRRGSFRSDHGRSLDAGAQGNQPSVPLAERTLQGARN